MANKRSTKAPDLKVVTSPAEASKPAAQRNRKRTTEERNAQLAEARKRAAETKRAQGERRAALRAAGVRPGLERYRAGEYPVSAWTDEEVARGKPANIDGSFEGPMPTLSGKQQAEIKKELLRRGQRQFDSLYVDAIRALHSVAMHGENESAIVKAADLLIQRVAGKTPERIEIKSADPWQDILDDVLSDEVLERVTESG